MVKTTNRIIRLIEPSIADMGFELLGVDYAANPGGILRIYIDSENGIRLRDCEAVSKQVGTILDVADVIRHSYHLEVSSPGVRRPLFTIAHYRRFLGHNVRLKLHRKMDGRRTFSGSIRRVIESKQNIEIATEMETVTIDFNLIDKAHLVVD